MTRQIDVHPGGMTVSESHSIEASPLPQKARLPIADREQFIATQELHIGSSVLRIAADVAQYTAGKLHETFGETSPRHILKREADRSLVLGALALPRVGLLAGLKKIGKRYHTPNIDKTVAPPTSLP